MRIVVLPVLSDSDLDIAFRYARRDKEASSASFDELHLWVNTLDARRIRACRALEAAHDWVRVAWASQAVTGGRGSLRQFVRGCVDPAAAYLALSPDLVWMAEGLIGRLLDGLEQAGEDAFVLFGDCANPPGGSGGLDFHRAFLGKAASHEQAGPASSRVTDRASIDTSTGIMCWRGADLARFGGRTTADVSDDLCRRFPRLLNKTNRSSELRGWVTCGGPLERLALANAGIMDAYAAAAPSFGEEELW
jgi:hypothetical protein